MSFDQFMERVNTVIAKEAEGSDSSEFNDAGWRDLYDETGGHASNRQIIDTLANADMIFWEIINGDDPDHGVVPTMGEFIETKFEEYANAKQALDGFVPEDTNETEAE